MVPGFSARRAALVSGVLLTLLACTEDGGEATDPHDEALCKVPAAFPKVASASATVGVAGGGHPTLTITLDAGPPRDTLFFKLISGAGAFVGGLRAGTFAISGPDAGFSSCGLCVNVVADIVAGQGPTKFYQATAGEVTLTSVTAPYAGSVANLVLGEVDLQGTAIPGCSTKVPSVTFSSN